MGFRKTAVVLALSALTATVVALGAASSGGAAAPAITLDLSCPPVLTPGTEWGCTGTIENLGPQSATHVTLVEEIPGATLLDSSFEDGTCDALPSGGISCELGNFSNGEVLDFTTIFQTSTTVISNTALIGFDEFDSENDSGKQDTVCANSTAPPPCVPLTAEVVPTEELDDRAGGHVAFGQADDTLATTGALSAAGEVLTELQIPFRPNFPFGFGATIFEAVDPAGDSCPVNVTCFGQTVEEDLVGQFAANDPVVGTFEIFLPKGKTDKNIVVYHDGQKAEACSATPLSATVDTCVFSRSKSPKPKVASIVVHTTDNGSWDFG